MEKVGKPLEIVGVEPTALVSFSTVAAGSIFRALYGTQPLIKLGASWKGNTTRAVIHGSAAVYLRSGIVRLFEADDQVHLMSARLTITEGAAHIISETFAEEEE